jgi:hypothetical protein
MFPSYTYIYQVVLSTAEHASYRAKKLDFSETMTTITGAFLQKELMAYTPLKAASHNFCFTCGSSTTMNFQGCELQAEGESSNHPDERGLAGSVGPQHSKTLSLVYL